LTQGDNIEISYNDKIYGILVMEIKPPGVGISIVETDLEVDFAPPVGYQEPTPQPRSRPIMVKELNWKDARIEGRANSMKGIVD